MKGALRRALRALIPLLLWMVCVLAQPGCTCASDPPPPPPAGLIACRPQHPTRPTVTKAPAATGLETVAAGSMPGSFSVTSTAEASFVMPLVTPPGRGVEPHLALTYSSAGGDGVLGRGFSLTGLSMVTRCPTNLSRDREIREVRYDAGDALCLDAKRLVRVGEEPGRVEYRTVPDARIKVIGHEPDEGGTPRSFEVFMPSGLAIAYGTSEGTRPLGPGGVPRAWVAASVRDQRGNSMTYGYCFADAGEHTAEFALDEIRYTHFEGSPALEASRAVKLVYGTKDPEDIRTLYAGGMALQSSLRLEQIQMVGPGEELYRSYSFSYELSPTTSRTLLTEVEECAGDGVCKPPTRFQYHHREAGFAKHTTSIASPTSRKASPILSDIDGDGLDDLALPDTEKALSTPGNPITRWLVAHNDGASASPAFLGSTKLAFSQEDVFVANPSGAEDPTTIQPELGSMLDYDGDGRRDVLLHDVYDVIPTWQVLLAQPDHTFKRHDTGIRRPFPLGVSPPPPTLTSRGGSMHLADVNGDHTIDLVQCQDHSATADVIPTEAAWHVHLWRPSQGEQAAGFDPEGERIKELGGLRCDAPFQTVDINADSKVDLLVQPALVGSDGTQVPVARYKAVTRLEDGSWEVLETKLPVVESGGQLLLIDVSGDGLPDAVESGFSDHALRTYINTGRGFAKMPVLSWRSGHVLPARDPARLERRWEDRSAHAGARRHAAGSIRRDSCLGRPASEGGGSERGDVHARGPAYSVRGRGRRRDHARGSARSKSRRSERRRGRGRGVAARRRLPHL